MGIAQNHSFSIYDEGFLKWFSSTNLVKSMLRRESSSLSINEVWEKNKNSIFGL